MNRAEVFATIDRLPKAELHVHVEGTIEPEMMLAMARRNCLSLPWKDVEAARAAYRFENLQQFLDVFYKGLTVMVTEEDFFDVTIAYLERAHADNIVHAEIFVSPQAHLRRGISFGTMMRGVRRAMEEARARFGMSVMLILLIQRHLPEEDGYGVVDLAEPWRADVVGFGLAGAERGNPPENFARLFATMRERGYKVVAHAGEEGPAAYVRNSLDVLKVLRVDHGVRAEDDPDLVDRLVREGVPLTVCPTANVRLGVFRNFADHNLRRLLAKGVKVTINSDDPSYFGAYLGDIYRLCVTDLDMTYEEIFQLCLNSFEAAFLPPERRARYLEELDKFAASSA